MSGYDIVHFSNLNRGFNFGQQVYMTVGTLMQFENFLNGMYKK